MLDMFLLLRIMNLRSGTIINQNATCSSGFNQPSKKTLLIQSCKKDMSPMTLMLHELLSHHLNVNYNVFVGNANIIYKIINYMLDDNLYTHQLPRASRFSQKFILAQHPQLDGWGLFDDQITTENWKEYLEKAKAMFGEKLEIEKIPSGVWTIKSPTEEAEEMFAKDKIERLKNRLEDGN